MKIFSEVARQGSFAGASEHLSMSRAMVTRQVAALESHLGVRLLNRTTRRLSLTDEGETYLARCTSIIEEVEYAESSIGEMRRVPRGRLRVSAPVAYGAKQLTPLISQFMSMHSQVRAELMLSDRFPDIAEDGVDVAIWVGPLEDSGIIARPFTSMRQIVCAAPSYLQDAGRPKNAAQLSEFNCLRYSYRSRPDTWRLQTGKSVEEVAVEGDFEANTGEALRVAALNGQGIVLLPDYMVKDDLEAGRLVEIAGGLRTEPVPVQALYLHRRHLSAKVRHFVDFLVAHESETVDAVVSRKKL